MPSEMIEIGEVKRFELEDAKSKYLVGGLDLYFCDDLASEYMPLIFDPYGYGEKPKPPEGIYYRIIKKKGTDEYCFQYYIYWPEQECHTTDILPSSRWRRLLNFLQLKKQIKVHVYDYEPILVFINFPEERPHLVVNNGLGANPTTHRIEIHSEKIEERDDVDNKGDFKTSPEPYYPFGGPKGQDIEEWYKCYPLMSTVYFKDHNPLFGVAQCSHVFSGGEKYKKKSKKILGGYIENEPLKLKGKRLDDEVLDEWYFKHYRSEDEEPFGHDVSDPFSFPHIRYFDPKPLLNQKKF